MRKTVLAVLFVALTSQLGFGQELKNSAEAAAYQDEVMEKELELTEDQKEKVSKINLKYTEQMTEIMRREGSKFSKIGDMKKNGKDKKEELKGVLTEDQFEKFEDEVEPALRKHMRKNMSF